MEFKTLGECVENKPKVECLKEGEAIICTPRQVAPEARQALSFILSELEAGREPTTREVAEAVKITQVGISRKLGELGIASQNTKRQMKSVRIYPRHLKDKIEELLCDKD